MWPKVLKIATGALSLGSSCYLLDSYFLGYKTAKWRKAAESEFWRASYTPAPTTYLEGTNLFKPRLDFPSSHKPVVMPWKNIDFFEQPAQYLQCLLRTCLDSNLEIDFNMEDKKEKVW